MVYSEGAKLVSAEELVEHLEEKCSNPTIERLYFFETKAANGDIKVFPCFISGYRKEKVEVPKAEKIQFLVYVVQGTGNGGFGMLAINLAGDEIGQKARIWDKPPKKVNREEIPWAVLEGGVQ